MFAENKKLPQFFYDSTEKDSNCEPLIDFWLSWTLRCAEVKYSEINPQLYDNARRILLFLIFGKNELNGVYKSNWHDFADKRIEKVEVWKQEYRIDLWLHITFTDGVKYALIIENKYYTHLREGQLERYKTVSEEYFKKHPYYKVKYFFLTAHDLMHQYDSEICKRNGFNFATIGQLKEIISEKPTGNALFDEFWFNWF